MNRKIHFQIFLRSFNQSGILLFILFDCTSIWHHISTYTGTFDHITPVLSELHWLPVRHRINFKIAAITHTVLQSQQLSYLAALIPRYAPVRSLRSSSSLSICVPLRKTSMAASRSFSSVAPKIWNALPGHLSSIPTLPAFRRALKHNFFLSAYPDSRTSGGITPSERITLRDTTPPATIVLTENTMPSS